MEPTNFRMLIVYAFWAVVLSLSGAVAAADMLFVDQLNPECTDSGTGTEDIPFCTISAAASEVEAGDTVLVASGNYFEEVEIDASGTEDEPIVFVAAPEDAVIVTGQDAGFDVSGEAWIVIQGFTVSATTSYGMRATSASHITFSNNRVVNGQGRGFYITYSSDITLADNLVEDAADEGIYVKQSTEITISGNHVARSGQPIQDFVRNGIYLSGTSDSLVSGNTVSNNTDSGIYLVYGTTGTRVVGNVTSHNARGYVRAAPGIEARDAQGNTIEANISHDNEDTGIQLYSRANNHLVVNNLCYNNGDHGIDALRSIDPRIIGNTVYANVTAGINVEGESTGALIANNISVDNGIDSPRTEGNIRVELSSTSGAELDYNLIFLSEPGKAITWGATEYLTLADFVAATDMELHGLETDPQWVAPSIGDFHLLAGSPAIDSANSGADGALAVDLEFKERVDDLATPNTGVGPRDFDDRGAYEFQPSGEPPNTPPQIDSGPTAEPNPVFSEQTAELTVSASDADGDPLTYTWSVPPEGGSIIGVGPIVTYTAPEVDELESYMVSVEVSDGRGGTATGAVDITVIPTISTLRVRPVADTWVDSRDPDATHGDDTQLEVDASPTQIAYLRFEVAGLTRVVDSAWIELEVTDRSPNGGRIHFLSDNTWDEDTVTFNTRPTIDGPFLDTAGLVSSGDIIELDVTPAIVGDGVYSFAIDSTNRNGAAYRSREGSTETPVLVIELE